MEFGIQIANMPPAKFREVAQTLEGLNYDLILFPDHLVHEGPERQQDPHALAYDHIAVAAALIEATKKIRIVKMTGINFPPITERLRMLDEALTCIRSLWTNEQTNFDGEFYHLKDAILWPKPIQKPTPPFLLGGGGKGLLRIAAKHADVINIISEAGKAGHISFEYIKRMTNETFREKVDFVRAEAKRHGRKPDAIQFSNGIFALTITDTREASRKTAEAMAPMFGMSVEGVLQSPLALIGTPEECIVELKRRAKEWDVTQFIFSGPIGQDEKGVRRLREEILAHV